MSCLNLYVPSFTEYRANIVHIFDLNSSFALRVEAGNPELQLMTLHCSSSNTGKEMKISLAHLCKVFAWVLSEQEVSVFSCVPSWLLKGAKDLNAHITVRADLQNHLQVEWCSCVSEWYRPGIWKHRSFKRRYLRVSDVIIRILLCFWKHTARVNSDFSWLIGISDGASFTPPFVY